MKKIFSLCLLSLFFLSLISTPLFAQEVADILEKMVEAKGGKKVLESIKDTTMSGFWEFTHLGIKNKIDVKPLSIPMKFYHKEPNKFLLSFEEVGKVTTAQAFDGETAWMVNSQTGIAKEESSEELKKSPLYWNKVIRINTMVPMGTEFIKNNPQKNVNKTLKNKLFHDFVNYYYNTDNDGNNISQGYKQLLDSIFNRV